MDSLIGIGAIGLLCIGLPAAAIAVWYFLSVAPMRRRRKQRLDVAVDWAQRNGWSHTKSDPSFGKRWQGRPFKNDGSGEDILHQAHRGRNVLMFTYGRLESGVVTYGDAYYGVVVVALNAPGPRLEVTPRESPNSGRFHDVFEVACDDAGFANAVFQPPLMEWMVNDPRRFAFRFENTDLVFWTEGRLDPDEGLAAADYLIDVAARLVDPVRR